MSADLEDIRSRLEAISEEVADLAMKALQVSINAGDTKRTGAREALYESATFNSKGNQFAR